MNVKCVAFALKFGIGRSILKWPFVMATIMLEQWLFSRRANYVHRNKLQLAKGQEEVHILPLLYLFVASSLTSTDDRCV